MLTSESPPNMIHVCRWWLPKLRCCHSPLQKNHSAEAFPHALNLEDATDLLFFSPAKFLLSKMSPLVLCSPILSPFILIPLSAFEPPRFLSLQHRNPLHQHRNHTPHYFSCTYEANSLPSVFSLLHHQESIWIHGGLQGTQTKAQNGPTTLSKTALELMRLSHVGFGSQNYQNQCFTPADSMNHANRSNRLQKKFENLTECSWKSEESMKKNSVQFRVRKREIWSKQAWVLRTSTCPYKLQLS